VAVCLESSDCDGGTVMMHKLIPAAVSLVLCSAIAPASALDSKQSSTASPEIAGFRCNNGVFVGAANVVGAAAGSVLAGAIARKKVFGKGIIAGGSGKATEWGATEICDAFASWWNGPPEPAERPTIISPEPILVARPKTFDQTLGALHEHDLRSPTRNCPPVYGRLSQVCFPH
jgi:hypothetical protein